MGFGHLHGLQKVSLVDCPGKVSSVLFFGGCNLRCPYCHNPALVLDPDSQPIYSFNYFVEFLQKRQGLVDVIVFSGGEPTLNANLSLWIETAQKYGFKVKLDTNGQLPNRVKDVLKYLDYIGLDFKTSLERMGDLGFGSPDKWLETLDIALSKPGLEIEVRTTCHPKVIDMNDFGNMASLLKLKGLKKWYLQQFHDVETIDLEINEVSPYTNKQLQDLADCLSSPEFAVIVRGL